MADMGGLWICHGTFMMDAHSNDSPVYGTPHKLNIFTYQPEKSAEYLIFVILIFLSERC